MKKQQTLRIGGVLLFLDGFFALLFGKKYVQIWGMGKSDRAWNRVIRWISGWPAPLVRLAGLGEMTAGLAVLRRVPFSVESVYGAIADNYATIDPGWRSWFYPSAHTVFYEKLQQNLPPGGKILDLGSGTGANMAALQELQLPFGHYTGVDRTPEMLAHARDRYGQRESVDFQQMNLTTDPLPAGPFDLIISTWVFEHLPDPVEVAHKAYSQLKPGGTMLLLLEVEGDSLVSKVMGWIYPVLSARLLSMQQINRFPGSVEMERFSGPVGDLALLTIQKL